jgi:phosphatidylserine/phosphatidylglycerophosphate/cardiolipin synthase-like enzyme
MHLRTPRRTVNMLAGLWSLLISLVVGPTHAADGSPARVAVYFSPSGGATDAVVRALNAATTQVLVQAYSFTSVPVAQALVDAHKRGVNVLAVLDKSNETEKYSAATFLVHAGIQTRIDAEHAIAHNKVMVIDSATVITGSFNFTKAAEEKNAENLLVIQDASELVKAYEANIQAHVAHAHPYQRRGPTGGTATPPAQTWPRHPCHQWGLKTTGLGRVPDGVFGRSCTLRYALLYYIL